MRFARNLVLLLVALGAAGCARVAFYSKENLEGPETGIKFFTPKPYVLVARTGAKDKPTEISVIYIPDLSNPVYAKPKSGLGSAKLSLSVSNGVLTTFGQETDTKIPELLTALGGLDTSIATAKKTDRETSLLKQGAPDYVQISKDLAAMAGDVDKQVAATRAEKTPPLTTLELTALGSFASALRDSAKLLSDPQTADRNSPVVATNLKLIMDNWDKQVQAPSAATSGAELAIRRNLVAVRSQIEAALGKLVPKAPEEKTFTLYEIDNSSGKTTLHEVKF